MAKKNSFLWVTTKAPTTLSTILTHWNSKISRENFFLCWNFPPAQPLPKPGHHTQYGKLGYEILRLVFKTDLSHRFWWVKSRWLLVYFVLTIDFGKPNSNFHLLSKKCPKLNLDTTFVNKKLLLQLLSANAIFVRHVILDKQICLDEKVKGIGKLGSFWKSIVKTIQL